MAETKKVPAGETTAVSLSVEDGETLLVLKRAKDGRVSIPLITHPDPTWAEPELVRLARDIAEAFLEQSACMTGACS